MLFSHLLYKVQIIQHFYFYLGFMDLIILFYYVKSNSGFVSLAFRTFSFLSFSCIQNEFRGFSLLDFFLFLPSPESKP